MKLQRISLVLSILFLSTFFRGFANAQTGNQGAVLPDTTNGAWSPSSTSTTPTPPAGSGPGTFNPGSGSSSSTTSGLAYTGSYCTGFTSTILLSSKNIGDLFHFVTCLIEVSIIPLMFAIAVLVFIYGVVKFIGTEESAEKEDGRQFMIWGIVALAVMFSIWGLVTILGNTFGVSNVIPQLPIGAK
jgi:hypothetical protein